ncbi:hypothetical protein [Bradyrhizobium barranii]
MTYPKPGDALPLLQPVLFDIIMQSKIEIDNASFPNPYHLSPIKWWKDGPRGSLQIPPGVVSQIPPPARQDKGLLV